MPTLVDSLMVRLDLDASPFVRNQKDATQAFRKAKDEAVASAKAIEESGNKGASALAGMAREALGLLAVFLTGRGIKEFIADITTTNSALGRLGANLNTAPRELAAFGLASEQMGGSAKATEQSFLGLSDKIQAMRHGLGTLPNAFYQLYSAAGRQFNINKPLEEQFFDLAEGMKNLAAAGKQNEASFLGRNLGIDDGTVNLMIKYGAALRGVVSERGRFAPGPEDIAAVQDLQKAWASVNQELNALGMHILSWIAPAMTKLLKDVEGILEMTPADRKAAADERDKKNFYSGLDRGLPTQLDSKRGTDSDPLVVRPADSETTGGGFWDNIWGATKRVFGIGGGSGGGDARPHGSGNDAIRQRATGGRVDTGGSGAGNLTKLIDEEARKAGVDPRVMEGIRAGESLHRSSYDKKDDAMESSWGPFQLNRRSGLGVQFERDTGLDLRNPNTIAAQARWVAKYLAKGGSLSAWHGYRGPRDADPRWGDSGYVPNPKATPSQSTIDAIGRAANPPGSHQGGPLPMPKMLPLPTVPKPAASNGYWLNDFAKTSLAARSATAGSAISNDNRSSSSELHVGNINIQTAATDAHGIANSISPAFANFGWTAQSNYGPA